MNVMDGSIYTAPPERINARWCCNSTSNAVAIEQLQLGSTATDQLRSPAADQSQLRPTATIRLHMRSSATAHAINCNCDQLQPRSIANGARSRFCIVFHELTPMHALRISWNSVHLSSSVVFKASHLYWLSTERDVSSGTLFCILR